MACKYTDIDAQAESQIADGLKDWDPAKDPNAVVRGFPGYHYPLATISCSNRYEEPTACYSIGCKLYWTQVAMTERFAQTPYWCKKEDSTEASMKRPIQINAHAFLQLHHAVPCAIVY
jgi:hypothetical protein